ncbi:hypothetical protein [Saccharothrix hoggarensis]|uniref:Nucleotide exchange factor GrpE n=1 Tax=Saccharothrix hoggarensis TaxID=913853 RepID=A0ABW3R5N7_9PSEU
MSRAWRRWRAEARQRRHHRPFRIAEPAWHAGDRARLTAFVTAVTTALADRPEPGPAEPSPVESGTADPRAADPRAAEPGTVQSQTAQPGTAESQTVESQTAQLGPTEPGTAEPGPAESGLAEAATNLWRARRKIAKAGVDASREGRQVARLLTSAQEALDRAGVVIQDHDGLAFHPDLLLDVLAFAEDPALTRDVVVETVRPSVYLGDRRIQRGQVVVGCPETGGGRS